MVDEPKSLPLMRGRTPLAEGDCVYCTHPASAHAAIACDFLVLPEIGHYQYPGVECGCNTYQGAPAPKRELTPAERALKKPTVRKVFSRWIVELGDLKIASLPSRVKAEAIASAVSSMLSAAADPSQPLPSIGIGRISRYLYTVRLHVYGTFDVVRDEALRVSAKLRETIAAAVARRNGSA